MCTYDVFVVAVVAVVFFCFFFVVVAAADAAAGGGVVVFIERSFFPTRSAVHPVSILIPHPGEIKIM